MQLLPFTVHFADRPAAGPVPPVTTVAIPVAGHTIQAYLNAMPSVVHTARRTAALAALPPGTTKDEAVDQGLLRQISAELIPVHVEVASSAPRRRYVVEGEFAYDHGPYSGAYIATNPAEAELMARWEMSEIDRSWTAGTTPDEGLVALLKAVRLHEIREVRDEPAPADEVQKTLASLAREAAAAGHSGPALDGAIAMLAKFGIEIEPAAAPAP